MKKHIIILFLFLFIGTTGYSQNWKTNFEEAKIEAAKENKNILLVFSGSDWCAPCIKLENVVWKSDAFQEEVAKGLFLKHRTSQFLVYYHQRVCLLYHFQNHS